MVLRLWSFRTVRDLRDAGWSRDRCELPVENGEPLLVPTTSGPRRPAHIRETTRMVIHPEPIAGNVEECDVFPPMTLTIRRKR